MVGLWFRLKQELNVKEEQDPMKTMKRCIGAAAVFLFLTGCTAFPKRNVAVMPGDKVGAHVTCRLNDGSMIYTSRPDADTTGEKKSSVFFAQEKEGPVECVADSGFGGPLSGKLKSFEYEIIACLSKKIMGMKLDEKRQITLETAEPADLEDQDRYLTMNIKRRYPLIKEVKKSLMAKETGKEPVVGDLGPASGPLSYVVRSVDGEKDKATVEMQFTDGAVLDMPFGPGVLAHDGDHYTIDIGAKVGHLIQTYPLLGRIIRVEDKRFVIDYGHPFAGETLACDVEIVSISKNNGGETP